MEVQAFFVPVDDYSSVAQWLNCRTVLSELAQVQAKITFLSLDCCRTNIMDIRSVNTQTTLDNIFFVFSTSPGQVASSPNQTGPGFFTRALCQRLLSSRNVNRDYIDMFKSVEKTVWEMSNFKQRPSFSGFLGSNFCFVTSYPPVLQQIVVRDEARDIIPQIQQLQQLQQIQQIQQPHFQQLQLQQPQLQQQQSQRQFQQLQLPPQPQSRLQLQVQAQVQSENHSITEFCRRHEPVHYHSTTEPASAVPPPLSTSTKQDKPKVKTGQKRCRGYDLFRKEWFANNKHRLGLQGAVGHTQRRAGEAWRLLSDQERHRYHAEALKIQQLQQEQLHEPAKKKPKYGHLPSTTGPLAGNESGSASGNAEISWNSSTTTSTSGSGDGEASSTTVVLERVRQHVEALEELLPWLDTGSNPGGSAIVDSSQAAQVTQMLLPLLMRVQQNHSITCQQRNNTNEPQQPAERFVPLQSPPPPDDGSRLL